MFSGSFNFLFIKITTYAKEVRVRVLCSEAEKYQSVETAGLVMAGNSNGEIVGMELALEKTV